MRIIDYFDRGAVLYPKNIAFMDARSQYSYREASERTHLIASALHAKSFGKGTRVALLAPNSNIAFLSLLGIFRAGAVWLPCNPRHPIALNTNLLHRFEVGLLLYHSVYEAQARQIARQIPSINSAVCIDDKCSFGEPLARWMCDAKAYFPPVGHSVNDALLILPAGVPTEPAPRIVVTHDSVATSFGNFYSRFHHRGNTRNLVLAPLAHSAGVLACLHFSNGGTNIINTSADPGDILRSIEEHGITHLLVTAALLNLMLMHPFVTLYDYSSLQLFMVSGGDTSPDKLTRAAKIFGPVVTTVRGGVTDQRDANYQIGSDSFWYKFAMEYPSSDGMPTADKECI